MHYLQQYIVLELMILRGIYAVQIKTLRSLDSTSPCSGHVCNDKKGWYANSPLGNINKQKSSSSNIKSTESL